MVETFRKMTLTFRGHSVYWRYCVFIFEIKETIENFPWKSGWPVSSFLVFKIIYSHCPTAGKGALRFKIRYTFMCLILYRSRNGFSSDVLKLTLFLHSRSMLHLMFNGKGNPNLVQCPYNHSAFASSTLHSTLDNYTGWK